MDDFEAEEARLAERRRQYLTQAAQPQGRMVGNVYVRPSVTEYLATGLRNFAGQKDAAMVDEELKGVRGRKQDAMVGALRGFTEQMQDRPAYQVGANEMDSEGYTAPERKANPTAAYGGLIASPFPELRNMGMQGIGQQAQFQQQAKMAEEAERRKQAATEAEAARKAQENQRILGVLQQTQGNPQAAIAAGVPPEVVKSFYESPNFGRSKVNFRDTGSALVPTTEYGETPQGIAPIPKTAGPANLAQDLLIPDPANPGRMIPNQALIGAKTGIAKAGATTVDARNYNTQESEQSKVYGKSLGEARAAINQAGYDAPAKLARLDRMESLLAGIDGGAAAPALADIASFANSLGVKLDPKLGNKQAAEALAREMASTLRQPGTGPMTDKDFDNFLKQVPSLSKTAEGRTEIIKTLRSAVARDQIAAKFARDYARNNNGTIDDNFFDAVADFYAKNPVVTPAMPATNARGQPFKDPDKEKLYLQWKAQQGVK